MIIMIMVTSNKPFYCRGRFCRSAMVAPVTSCTSCWRCTGSRRLPWSGRRSLQVVNSSRCMTRTASCHNSTSSLLRSSPLEQQKREH